MFFSLPQPKTFRPPYGNINNQAREVLAQRGYTGIYLWNADTGDSVGKSESYQQKQIQKMVDSYPSPHMLLSHEVFKSTTGTVLPEAIKSLQKVGYSLVTASECAGTGSDPSDWYEEVGGQEERNVSTPYVLRSQVLRFRLRTDLETSRFLLTLLRTLGLVKDSLRVF